MGFLSHKLLLITSCVLVSSCAGLQTSVREEAIELQNIKAGIECELAAVLREKKNAAWDLSTWDVKSTLDLTVVRTIGADGKVAWVIPAVAAIKLTPTLGAARKDTRIGHLEFTTNLKELDRTAAPECMTSSNPSETGMGLAAWIDSTLLALSNEKKSHRGLSYTSEFEIAINADTRFGYTITNIDADVGGGVTRVGTNRLSVAIAPPAGDPAAIPVYNVPNPNVINKNGVMTLVNPPAGSVSRENPNINRMLILRAPVRIER